MLYFAFLICYYRFFNQHEERSVLVVRVQKVAGAAVQPFGEV